MKNFMKDLIALHETKIMVIMQQNRWGLSKLSEELDEFHEAQANFNNYKSKSNWKKLIDEVADVYNIATGIILLSYFGQKDKHIAYEALAILLRRWSKDQLSLWGLAKSVSVDEMMRNV